jgi:hypothetical protein
VQAVRQAQKSASAGFFCTLSGANATREHTLCVLRPVPDRLFPTPSVRLSHSRPGSPKRGSVVFKILARTDLPEGRAVRCRELLRSALALTDHLLGQAKLPAAGLLGRKEVTTSALTAARRTRSDGYACVEDIDYRASRGLDRTLMRSLPTTPVGCRVMRTFPWSAPRV